MTWFIRSDLTGAKFNKIIPRRECDLIEFIKTVELENEIVAVEIDKDSHIISFGVVEKKFAFKTSQDYVEAVF